MWDKSLKKIGEVWILNSISPNPLTSVSPTDKGLYMASIVTVYNGYSCSEFAFIDAYGDSLYADWAEDVGNEVYDVMKSYTATEC